jgi:hypothetical protein
MARAGACELRARHFVGFFGVREVALGGLLFAARGDLRQLRTLAALGRWPTWGDSALLLRELLGRRRVEPAALALIGTGLSGSAAALAFWLETRRADRGVSAS